MVLSDEEIQTGKTKIGEDGTRRELSVTAHRKALYNLGCLSSRLPDKDKAHAGSIG